MIAQLCLFIALAQAGGATKGGAPVADDLAAKRAQAYVDLGTLNFKAGDFRGALSEFRRALPLVAGADLALVRWQIARTLEELSRDEESIAAFEVYLSAPDSAEDAAAARARIGKLEARSLGSILFTCVPLDAVARLETTPPRETPCGQVLARVRPGTHTFRVVSKDRVAHAASVIVEAGKRTDVSVQIPALVEVGFLEEGELKLDGRVVSPAGGTLKVKPGRHRLEFLPDGEDSAPGWRAEVVGAAGARVSLKRRAMETESAVAVEDTAASSATPSERPSKGPLPWVLAGTGAAALVTGGVLYSLGSADFDSAETNAKKMRAAYDAGDYDSSDAFKQDARSDLDGYESKTVGAYVCFGGAAVLGGVATWLFSRDEKPTQTQVLVTPNGAVFSGRF